MLVSIQPRKSTESEWHVPGVNSVYTHQTDREHAVRTMGNKEPLQRDADQTSLAYKPFWEKAAHSVDHMFFVF